MTFDIVLPILSFGVDSAGGGVIDAWMKANAGSYYAGLSSLDSTCTMITAHFTQDPGSDVASAIDTYWNSLSNSSPEATTFASNRTLASVKIQVAKAKAFADDLVNHFDAENLILGIDSDNMVDTVVTIMQPTMNALLTGSLTSAIARAKAISPSSYDAKYVTAARILTYVNKMEAYLGLPLSTSLS